jgi:hypothetical protein
MAKNPWIDFLSAYRKSHKSLSMSQAMKAAAVEYRKKKGAPKKKKGKSRKK